MVEALAFDAKLPNTIGADEHIKPSRKTVLTDFFPITSAKAPTCGDLAYIFSKS